MNRQPPELLAPAGDHDCLRAAIENGADAVYFGLQHGFNARFRAGNFSLAELPQVMEELRLRGVKGYVTLNTLAFPSELPTLEETLRIIAQSQVDAILVQDLGVARLAREVCPDLSLHASTQMTLTCAQAIAAVRELGIERVVLPREASLHDIRRIAKETTMPLEVFVHGALCVAYSGQCLTSESLGGRSANRGQCAQACRLPYELICDQQPVDLGNQKYLLSPLDLATYDLVPQLVEAGVASLKIEGRLKTAEYVAATTAHYRRAVDAAMAGQSPQFSREDVTALEQTFSRGLSLGWTNGCDHKALVPGLTSSKRGVFAGSVRAVSRRGVTIQVATTLAPGDGIVFAGDREKDEEQGGRIFAIYEDGQRCETEVKRGIVELRFGQDAVDLEALSPGQHLWKTDDPRLSKRLRATFDRANPQRKLPITLQVTAQTGTSLCVIATLSDGRSITLTSEHRLVKAERHPLTEELLTEQFGRLGKTQFQLTHLEATITDEPMVPLSVLGQLRRELVERLQELLKTAPTRTVTAGGALTRIKERDAGDFPQTQASDSEPAKLWVLCRELAQLESVIATQPDGIYLEFHDIRQYRPASEILRQTTIAWYLATLRIQLPDENGLLRVLARTEPTGFLVRHLAALDYYRQTNAPLIADFSLNAANELSVAWLLQQGATRVTPSYDLNREQLLELVSASQADRLEVVIHQHMPMFHMQHCVFCSVLSPGKNKTDCGRPCDTHVVELEDRKGKRHRLGADVGCRNTVFNGTPQSAAEAIPALQQAGVKNFRIELVDETPQQIRELMTLYRDLLNGQTTPKAVWQTLKAANRVGVTRGTLEDRPELLGAM